MDFETQKIGGKCEQFLSILTTKRRSKLSNDRSCYLEKVTGATTGYWEGISMISNTIMEIPMEEIEQKLAAKDLVS